MKGALGSQQVEQVSPWGCVELEGRLCRQSLGGPLHMILMASPHIGGFSRAVFGAHPGLGGYWRSYWLPQMTDHLVSYAFKDARGFYQKARCEYYAARVTEFTGVW